MKENNKKYLEIAKTAALEAGKYLVGNFGKNRIVQYKSEFDISLAEDRKSERIILDILMDKFPKHNFYLEESGEIRNQSKFTWYVDPLDGTNNFYAGIPYFAVSIALLFEDEILAGIVYNPISNQLFEAVKDGGAFLNGKQIHGSKKNNLNRSVCSFIQGHSVAGSETISQVSQKIQNKLSQKVRRVIKSWAPSLDWSLLAFGGIDALISFESELEDMYAGLLIAKEAGVEILNFDGYAYKMGDKRIVASNSSVIKDLFSILN